MDKVFTALNSDVRRQILVYLASEDLTFKEIRCRFPFSGPAILYHLRMLDAAGFIERRSQRYFLMSDNVVAAFNMFLGELHGRTPSAEAHCGDVGEDGLPAALKWISAV
jgi:predicted transcriptional regulator